MTNDEAMKAAFQANAHKSKHDLGEMFALGWNAARLYTLTEDPLVIELRSELSNPLFTTCTHVAKLWKSCTCLRDTARFALGKFDTAVAIIKDGGK